ncbi:G2/mitotic-specific cyclin S13-7 [Trifolium repens]|nr:G2/mitotic-specific cyclin S13-7 [Trifolium repens]
MQPQHRLIKFPQLTSSVLVPRKELQLVGISSMLIASRYEELLSPKAIVCNYVDEDIGSNYSDQILLML